MAPHGRSIKQKSIWILAVVALALTLFLIFKPKEPAVGKQEGYAVPVDSAQILWYKKSIIYTLDVEVFQDSDGDGIGDFNGLTRRLDYIDTLGADVIWLSPFQPTPNLDDGYDVSDYYRVDPRLGSITDFQKMIMSAKKRGMKVIMDLVLNHTSNQHPWFQKARMDTTSPYHSWYIWSKEKPGNINTGMVFPGVQKTTWTFDSVAKAYYYHRFYDFQPDLNTQNPQVQQEVKKIIRFWIDQGVAGFRMDAVPFYIEVPKTDGKNFDHQFGMLTDMRRYLTALKKDAVILGEANVLPEEMEDYFGKTGDGMNMMFNFFVNQHLFLSMASEDAGPIEKALQATGDIPGNSQWGQFLRNHDEVDLGRLSKKERESVYEVFGPQKNMQLYERGIRRRLAPMLNNDLRRLELAGSLLLSLPSTPVLRYGDEIGMGDDLSLKERESVRTPMQWSTGQQAGFSVAAKTIRPVIDPGIFSFMGIKVANEMSDSASFLRWNIHMVQLRKKSPEIAFGTWTIIPTGNPRIMVMHYQWQGKNLIVIHNFSRNNQTAMLSKKDLVLPRLESRLNKKVFSPDSEGAYKIQLSGYEFDWLSDQE